MRASKWSGGTAVTIGAAAVRLTEESAVTDAKLQALSVKLKISSIVRARPTVAWCAIRRAALCSLLSCKVRPISCAT